MATYNYTTIDDAYSNNTKAWFDGTYQSIAVQTHSGDANTVTAGWRFRIPTGDVPADLNDITAATVTAKFVTAVTLTGAKFRVVDDATSTYSTSNYPIDRYNAATGYTETSWNPTTTANGTFTSPDFVASLRTALSNSVASGGYYYVDFIWKGSNAGTPAQYQVISLQHPSDSANAMKLNMTTTYYLDGSATTTAPTAAFSVPTPTAVAYTSADNVGYTNGATLAAKDTPDTGLRTMDIYMPAGTAPSGGWPTVVWVHGGGWNSGVKENLAANGPAILYGALARGFAVVVLDYRLTEPKLSAIPNSGNEVTFPGPVHDVKVALRFLRNDADGANTYNLNPDRTVLTGYSAGGQVVQFAAYSYGDTTTYEGVDTTSFDGTRPAHVNRSNDAAHYYFDFTQNSDGTWTPPTIKGLFLFAGVVNVRKAITDNANTTARAANSDARRAYVNRHVFFDGSSYETNSYDELDVDHYIAGTASTGTSVTTATPYYGKAPVVPDYPIGYAASTVDAQIPLASGYTALKTALTAVGYIGSDPTADVVYPSGLSYFPNSTLTHEQMEGNASVAASFFTWLEGIDTTNGVDGSATTTAPTATFSVPTPGAAAQFDGSATSTAPTSAFTVPAPGVSVSAVVQLVAATASFDAATPSATGDAVADLGLPYGQQVKAGNVNVRIVSPFDSLHVEVS